MFKLTACLIAGGLSSRMGRDKSCLDFDGQPLWMRQLQTLNALKPDEILISGRKTADYAASGHVIVEDQVQNTGPLAGIAAALSRASHPLVLVLAVDMPRMTDACLHALLSRCSRDCGAVPERDGFFEGVAAVFPKATLPLAETALRDSDHSIQHFVRECAARDLVKIIPVTELESPLFKSLNTPADLPRILQNNP